MDVILDSVRAPLSRTRVTRIAEDVLRAERVRNGKVQIVFMSSAGIASANREHLRHPWPTDVLTFRLFSEQTPYDLLADIFIAPDVVRGNAHRFRESVRVECARVVIHGVLHAVGYDHPEDESREKSDMWRLQERYLARYYTGDRP